MNKIKLDISNLSGVVSQQEIDSLASKVTESIKALEEKTGLGNDFLGWVKLPSSISNDFLGEIKVAAKKMQQGTEVVVVIGIGGSYLGSRAVAEALTDSFAHLKNNTNAPHILFAGQNIGEDYMTELLGLLEKKSFGLVVISKSGTTTEPAIAFRILKDKLEEKIGKEAAADKIIAITDASKGALRTLADENGYTSFVIPDDVGGRYSVLTPVGLVPLAIGGYDIDQLVKGAKDMEAASGSTVAFENNLAARYAATRNALYNKGKKIEILANYNNKLHFFAEWWKQLYGESEGKDGKGIFPASVDLTADLHSMGQYIQEGERHLFETVISVAKPDHSMTIPGVEANLDKLNYLAGKNIDHVNKMAELGTMLAHVDGGVPNLRIEIPKLDAYNIGQLIYFFEIACGISGYILGVNPFDQPGVEAYKKNMFALLEKPGFEEETAKIKNKLG